MRLEYSSAFPEQLREACENNCPLIVPIGALEWHGNHLPFGVDGMIAQAFCERLADATVGTLHPCVWHPMTTLPHRFSQQLSSSFFPQFLDEILAGFAKSEFSTVCLVTGHYAQGHMVELYNAALRCSSVRVFAAAVLEPLYRPELLDHAGAVETSLMLAIASSEVRLNNLSEVISPEDGILGSHPKLGSAQVGEELLQEAVGAWKAWIEAEVNLELHYENAKKQFTAYQAKYYTGNWDDAIETWWREKLSDRS